ncbi:MAG: class I SAM-dependent methyltransferase [Bryobacteraceae bacterium]
MNMSALEKRFVNAEGHSRSVANLFERRLRHIPDVSPGMRYLDVGCGNGAAAARMATAFGLEVTGVDADPEQVRLARAAANDIRLGAVRGSVRFEEARVERLPFPDEAFEIVGTNKMTHHVPDWSAAIAEMARVLARGGYLVYGDFVFPEWLARLGRRVVPGAGYPTVRGLEAAADAAGMAPIQWTRGLVTLEAVWWKPGPPVR